MIGRIATLAVGLCLFGQLMTVMTVGPASAEPRVALVIGNSHYGGELGTLPNPVNDAHLVARALKQTGFDVIEVTDVDQKKMKRAIADFGDKLASAGQSATGLFYYAGHGVQVQGANYLIPVDADISKEADVDIEAISADAVMQQMEFAGSRVNIVILDACRNNPLSRSMRSMTRGLAPLNAVQGTFVAYSTAPGSVAADGSGSDSPYSTALANVIVQPGLGIEEAFREIRTQVMSSTDNKQIPWDSSSLTAPFYFKGQAAAQYTTAPAATPGSAELEATYWRSIQNSSQAGDYQAYLQQYPNGTFAGLARSRLASMGQGVNRAQPATPVNKPVTMSPSVPTPAPAPTPTPVPTTTTSTDTSSSSDDDSSSDDSSSLNSAEALKKFCSVIDDTNTDYVTKCRRNKVNYGGKH
jgi:carboxyl-terminal processing protease